jgi:hypothetical protein
MTNEQINRAIAVLRGWRFVEDHPDYEPYWEDPAGNMIGAKSMVSFPNSAGCLNAMHEAEKILTPEQECKYLTTLCLEVQTVPSLFNATARQRAEAFLRTLGKWEEEE